jgi:hypothetical protein
MRVALMHKHYDEEKLKRVIEEMKVLGAPKIKAVWMEVYGCWAALEGCHRLRAAKVLGFTPEIEEIDYDEDVTLESIGCDCPDESVTVAYIADGAFDAEVIEFETEN